MDRFCWFLILFEVRLQVVSGGKRQERKKKKKSEASGSRCVPHSCKGTDLLHAQLYARDWVPGSLHPGGCKLMTVRAGLSGRHLAERHSSVGQGHALWTTSVCSVCVWEGCGCASARLWRSEDILKRVFFPSVLRVTGIEFNCLLATEHLR